MLSEEGHEDPRRFGADRVWIVDPLDGTREFSEPGRIDWAVHIALVDRGPLRGRHGEPAGPRAERSPPTIRRPCRRSTAEHPRLVTSRSRAPYTAVLVAEGLDCEAVRLGSAGAKAMSVVMGETDIYVHDGGMYQWDSAAPAGGHAGVGVPREPARRLTGIVYNDRDPWLPDFIVSHPSWPIPCSRRCGAEAMIRQTGR